MIYAVLILIVVIAFLLGVTFVYKGISEKPQVALEDFEKVKEELAASRQTEGRLKSDLESATKEIGLVKKNLEEAQNSRQKSQQELAVVQDTEKGYKSRIRDFEEKLSALYTKADAQAKNALELISTLRQENEAFKQKAETPSPPPAPAAPDPEVVQTLTKETENLKVQSQELSAKIQQLEQDLAAQKSESEKQLAEANKTIEGLKAQPAAAPAVPATEDAGKVESERLRSENEQLKLQIAEGLAKIQEFENTITQLKAQPAVAPAPVVPAIPAAPAVPSEADLAQQAELKRVNEDLQKMVEQLKAENAAIAAKPVDVKVSPDLEAQINKLKELNEFLTRKDKMLQTELTKSRVKALGLERICADFKTQLEMMAQRVVKV